jgi:hypothetical protein
MQDQLISIRAYPEGFTLLGRVVFEDDRSCSTTQRSRRAADYYLATIEDHHAAVEAELQQLEADGTDLSTLVYQTTLTPPYYDALGCPETLRIRTVIRERLA